MPAAIRWVASLFSVLGDWDRQTNWGARNCLVPGARQRRQAQRLRRPPARRRASSTRGPARTSGRSSATTRELLPLVRHGFDSTRIRASRRCWRVHGTCGRRSTRDSRCGSRRRCGPASPAAATRAAPPSSSTSTAARCSRLSAIHGRPREIDTTPASPVDAEEAAEALLDRARYGLYPPGSTFKLLVAGAALRSRPARRAETFACVRLPDGRVGNFVQGLDATGPRRSDGHGAARRRRPATRARRIVQRLLRAAGIRLGPQPILDAASLLPDRGRAARDSVGAPSRRCRTPATARRTCSYRH